MLSTCTGLSPSSACLPRQFQFFTYCRSAGPISLAATFGVSVDFLSCRYLDVSVPYVRFNNLFIQLLMTINGRVSPFRYPRINAYSQLPAAFRSVSRLSSPLIAKASTKCPYLSLDSYNINILLFILHTQQKIFSYPFSFTEKLRLCIFLYLFPRFFDNIICFISYYSAFSLFTMFYNYPEKRSFGGGKENRTPDPLLAKQVLSQLSYTPNSRTAYRCCQNLIIALIATVFFCAVYKISTQTKKIPSKKPIRRFWWVWEDSNFRPYAYQAYALTT